MHDAVRTFMILHMWSAKYQYGYLPTTPSNAERYAIPNQRLAMPEMSKRISTVESSSVRQETQVIRVHQLSLFSLPLRRVKHPRESLQVVLGIYSFDLRRGSIISEI
jgi:hypothetical protein